MRDILFKGKRKDNGEWVEGYYAGYGVICPNEPEDTYNATGDYCGMTPYVGFVEVDPETVGQYTGLTCKNGKKIFEGDIVKLQMSGYEMKGHIIFEEATFYIMADDVCEVLWYEEAKFEVIGNIHDNPELLEN